ncbi:MAG: hypothetical protein HRT51_06780 [Colwellia sp.]|nr:hypothetical protein [Colwellia sp.]
MTKLPPIILICTWLDIAANDHYPEAQQMAFDKLNLYFDDYIDAEDYVEALAINLIPQAV